MNCPACSIPLNLAERQGVEIDYCPRCRGVWLDRGELDKLIDRAAVAPPPYADDRRDRGDARYGRDRDDDRDERYGEQRGPHRRKRGGFLGELFDFD